MKQDDNTKEVNYTLKKSVSLEGILCLLFTFGGLFLLIRNMGVANMFNTV